MSPPVAVSQDYIAIEGVIGAGKTTLARMLADRVQGRLLLEAVEENPFLEVFYKDMRRWAFQTQMFFVTSRYRQQVEFVQGDVFFRKTISDYIFQKDRIFANITLDDRELDLYNRIVPIMERDIPRPDLVIYLQASVPVLLRRVEKRGRSFERTIDPAYIATLNEAYNYFFFHYNDTPLLVVNTNEIDFVEREEDLGALLERVAEHPGGTVYYTPRSQGGGR
jgi:deoxyadenosine/deoxycytidine kinase